MKKKARTQMRKMRKGGFIKPETARKVIDTVVSTIRKGAETYRKYKHYIDPTVQFGVNLYKTYRQRKNGTFDNGVKQKVNSNSVSAAPNMNQMSIPSGMYTNPASMPGSESKEMKAPKKSLLFRPNIGKKRPLIKGVKYGGGSELLRGPIA